METAAIREAKEETTLSVTLKYLLGVYSDPKRDPRGHTISVVYVAESEGEPRARDDALNARICLLNQLPETLAFDHETILADYLRTLND